MNNIISILFKLFKDKDERFILKRQTLVPINGSPNQQTSVNLMVPITLYWYNPKATFISVSYFLRNQ